MTVKIGCLVEGESEVKTVPLLIRRIAANLYPELPIVVLPPIRRPRNQVVKENELERAVEFVARQIGGQGAIFIILDSDDDCPAELGPALLHRASQARSDLPIAVVIAKNEFEAWFLAAAESLRGKRGLGDDIYSPDDPEVIRDAKKWLSQRMEDSRTYRETQDQPALAALFDIEQARQVDSFDKCYRDIVRLLDELRKASDPSSV
ncbi:DUF4276 family protein [Candidatus Poribacteria bacterium]|nr:DUF4276 family protein [Candidatus Poribacteria bacterium]